MANDEALVTSTSEQPYDEETLATEGTSDVQDNPVVPIQDESPDLSDGLTETDDLADQEATRTDEHSDEPIIDVGQTDSTTPEADNASADNDNDTALEASSDDGWERITYYVCGSRPEEDVYYDSAEYQISADGTLIIRPVDGVEGTVYMGNFLGSDRERVKRVRFVGTIHVLHPEEMFTQCKNLVSIDLTGLDLSSATSMMDMFAFCDSLTSIDLSALKTDNVTDMHGLCRYCKSLRSAKLAGLDTSSVTNMVDMFEGCEQLASINLSAIDTSSVKELGGMFFGCASLKSIDLSALDTTSVISANDMFSYCKSLQSVSLRGFSFPRLKSVEGMFSDCSSLRSVDFSYVAAPSLSNMSSLFLGCTSLRKVDFTGIKSAALEGVGGMFDGCEKLNSIDLSSFDLSKSVNFAQTFANCKSLTSIDTSSIRKASPKYLSGMFYGCSSLTSLNLSGLDATNVEEAESVFAGCTKLSTLNLKGFKTSTKTRYYDQMFMDCRSLRSLDLSSFVTTKAYAMGDMFKNCNSLYKVKLGKRFDFRGRGRKSLCSLPKGSWKSSATKKTYASSRVPNRTAATYTRTISLSRAKIRLSAKRLRYTGKVQHPSVTSVTLSGATLKKGKDYRVSFKRSKKPGTYVVTIKGKGGFTGRATAKYTIVKAR